MEGVSNQEGFGNSAEEPDNSIYALKTSAGQERNVARMLAGKARDNGIDITAVIVPESLKGYILVESSTKIDMKNPALKIPHLRGLVEGKGTANHGNTISFEEVKKFLRPEPIISSIMKGSIVELVSGPFKGERAKIVRIDESREETVLELIEAAVPIPITVKADQIRIIQKEAD
ncbi:MAG: transcription elongation factor Spt5 [Methanobrevibacter sp.]|jgi:transcriptional antiterminator NusG|nr:transcription elongation factor Spt5 [Candidatus Methanovirga aequatorialis]